MTDPRMADREKLFALVEKLKAQGMKPKADDQWLTYYMQEEDERPRPVTLEAFFDGIAEVSGHIAANLIEHPGEAAFYELLKAIRARETVADVRVGVSQIEIELADPSSWVYADTVYIITKEKPEAVIKWFHKDIAPDEVDELPRQDLKTRYGFFAPPPGTKWLAAWWD
ncbi:MAG: hypothetical protein SF162_18445 [bacterium]|nr:hypothetical protein [bacterium]